MSEEKEAVFIVTKKEGMVSYRWVGDKDAQQEGERVIVEGAMREMIDTKYRNL